MKLDDMSLLAVSPRHKIVPVGLSNSIHNDNIKTSQRLPVSFDDAYSVVTTTKVCSAGVWTVRVCNGAAENNSGVRTRSCAVHNFTQSRLNFSSPPKMIIKLSRRDCSMEPCLAESASLENLTNGHFHSVAEPTTISTCNTTKANSAQRRKSGGRAGRRRKAAALDNDRNASTAVLANHRTVSTASLPCDTSSAVDGRVNGHLSHTDGSDSVVNGYATENVAATDTAACNAAAASIPFITTSNSKTTTHHMLNGSLHSGRGLTSPVMLRNVKHKHKRINRRSKAGYTAVTPNKARSASSDQHNTINSLMTDFFPVRRSSRTTSVQIKKREKQEMEEFVLSEKEEGFKIVEISGKGRGVVVKRAFSRGEYLVEYAGELVDHAVAKEREEKYSLDQRLGCYMYYFTYKDRKYCVDATKETPRLGRLINHSRLKPNCATKIIDIEGRPRLIFIALRRIEAGEELLYDYGDRDRETLGSHPWLAF